MTDKQGPIGQMLEAYAQEQVVRMHMPGHKGHGPDLLRSHDVTEVPGTDDLHDAQAGILQAQQALARLAGAAHSFFLVGGSTCGIHAMLLASLPRGGRFLTTRHVHRSVVNAAVLYGLEPIFVETVERDGLPDAPTEAMLAAIRRHPEAQAVLVTRPDYYGRCLDLAPLAQAAEAQDMLLLVDAAHGAHLSMGGGLPPNPSGQADFWVESAHKTLPALTQAAWLHAGPKAPVERVARALDWVETSSPSYLLMQSLDEARLYAEQAGPKLAVLLDRLAALRQQVEACPGLVWCGQEWTQAAGYGLKDPTRVVVDVRDAGYGGLKAAAELRRRGVQVEMADLARVVAIATPEDQAEDLERLGWALTDLAARPGNQRPQLLPLPPVGRRALPLAQAARGTAKRVAMEQAAGCIAAEAVGAYPPGEPCWLPGEIIVPEALAYLQTVVEQGGSLFGCKDNEVEVVAT